jgi:hypothetical protein
MDASRASHTDAAEAKEFQEASLEVQRLTKEMYETFGPDYGKIGRALEDHPLCKAYRKALERFARTFREASSVNRDA